MKEQTKWIKHLMGVKNSNPKMTLSQAMKEAKKTYKK